MYRFMDDAEASRLFDEMKHTAMRPDSIGAYRINNVSGTRVVVVILESFSSYIMTEEGHVKGVTPTLDRLSKEGVYFNHFYANSFRTDRGLVSILSGYPAQPNMSLMKYPRKTNNLYSIARSLRNNGFHTQYVYGGDANFTNMRSYLMATGFQDIISEDDFPSEQLTGKWGANDGNLFAKALERMDEAWKDDTKNLMVIQTSSSHEPFDVPCHQFDDKILNAFYYTDRELGSFVEKMKAREDWKNTLMVIVPDHLGCWPDPEDNYKMRRYHIPLIMVGGALKEKATLGVYGSQQDIAATVLGMLGIDHSEFTFSKDLFDTTFHHFAFFTHPDAVGMADEYNQIMVDNPSQKPLFDLGTRKGTNKRKAQAYLQKLFDDIAKK
jgi:phosphoglycerol transferase MdoB-like AlkP superfamily enzyme